NVVAPSMNEMACSSIEPPFHSVTINKKIAKNWLSSLRVSCQSVISRKLSDSARVSPLIRSVSEVNGSIRIPCELFGFRYDGLLLLETIAYAMFSEDIYRISGVRFNLAPKLADIHAGVINIVDILMPPDLFEQIALRHDTSCAFHQNSQQFKFGGS